MENLEKVAARPVPGLLGHILKVLRSV